MAERVLCVCHDQEALPVFTLSGQNPREGRCQVDVSDAVVPAYGADLESFLTPRRSGAPQLNWRRHKLRSKRNKRGHYANFAVPDGLSVPCRCNKNADLNHQYRVYRNGRVIHLRCGDTVVTVNPHIFEAECRP